ncbi:glycoside hydrolase domain-containing protein [Rapidithrix thailandica]|uniref:Glycoside hydrolase domain-containing protein n=1 Tax=Rapidithrix thailandica TaxID=413964 RepID=A0AAW9S7Y4_9BACT
MRIRYLYLILIIALSCQRPLHDHKGHKNIHTPSEYVNVFLGSSGDNGQLSPAASYPFSMLSIGPHTYPSTHTGYEYKAKEFLGFTHNRLEGVGCQGSGGNLLVKPFLGSDWESTRLIKKEEKAYPGYYSVRFTNQISAEFAVVDRYGAHRYAFPQGEKGFYIDLSHSIVNRFRKEEHHLGEKSLSGWIEARTTCGAGQYRLYYYLEFDTSVQWKEVSSHRLVATVNSQEQEVGVHIAFSSVNVEYAKAALRKTSFEESKTESAKVWNTLLGQVEVEGEEERVKLFYSLLYRALQSPYRISEEDGYYKAIDGSIQQSSQTLYHGWAIWDNYRTQLPLLSLMYPDYFQDMATSIANLYPYGKKDFASEKSPAPTVRTEHAIVVLLDAYRKGYKINFDPIIDSLIHEVDALELAHPDKALESAYDAWALAEILTATGKHALAKEYSQKAMAYQETWRSEFQDVRREDVDRMGARGMYQGTVWQYRWFVPFDQKGLIELAGGEDVFLSQLDEFFDGDYYNHANQPDLQVPGMYQGTSQPWKSQEIIHRIAVDTMVQHYFNNNSRGTESYIGKIYKNQPEAYIRTMDDDAGTMSSWYVWASTGLFPACVGEAVYYLHAPLLEHVSIRWPKGNIFTIRVENYDPAHAYIRKAIWKGKPLNRNWLSHEEIAEGGELLITTSASPNPDWGVENRWISSMENR